MLGRTLWRTRLMEARCDALARQLELLRPAELGVALGRELGAALGAALGTATAVLGEMRAR